MRTDKHPARFIRAIYAAAREQKVTNEELHEAIWVGFQKRSVKDLTTSECMQLLDGLRGERREAYTYRKGGPFSWDRRVAMNAHGRRDFDQAGEAEYLVNDRERKLLAEAAELRGWSAETLHAFIARQLGRESVRTMAEFNKIFWALKGMNRRDKLCK